MGEQVSIARRHKPQFVGTERKEKGGERTKRWKEDEKKKKREKKERKRVLLSLIKNYDPKYSRHQTYPKILLVGSKQVCRTLLSSRVKSRIAPAAKSNP